MEPQGSQGCDQQTYGEVAGELNQNGGDQESFIVKQIKIQSLNHGFIVTVGCQQFAIEDRLKLINLLSMYLANPKETERQYFQNTLQGLTK